MTYLAELRAAWRPLLAATIGLATGMSTAGTVTSAIAPSLIADQHWSKAEFALVGSLALVTSFAFPFIGRLADVLGVRWTALIGMATLPLAYLAYSQMSGELWVYVAIFFVQSLLCVTTTATVYTRLVVQYVEKARGLALAIAVSGPAISGAIGGPILNAYVEAHGWRASYQALAIFAVIAAVVTFLLIPPERPKASGDAAAPPKPKRRARDDYPAIIRTPTFWILLGVMLLCNLPATIMLVQLKLLLLANGVTGEGASVMFTALSLGMLTGRFVAGIALDRFRAHIVAFVTLSLPSIGLFIMASSYDAPAVLTFAVFCLGFAFGAEGDIVGFLVARHFGVAVYSSVMGLLTCAMSFSTASGAALLSATMAATGGYDLYLVIVGVAVLMGASLLLLLGRSEKAHAVATA
ncbi:MAG: MFS transporter [Sphingomonadales bacterium]|nr:MFS transporter [Sphingomonadales bacterium]